MRPRLLSSFLAAVLVLGALTIAADEEKKTLRGQVVCSGCWDEESDRRAKPYGTKGDLECAARCEKKGLSASLAVDDKGTFRLYELAVGDFKREGKGWLSYMGKEVEITGRVREAGKTASVRVDTLKLVNP